jgi:large subunit ribosomal protein L4
MDIKTYNQSGKAGSATSVSEKLFGAKMNADLVWQVATSQMSNKRQVLAHAKTRAEVRGGGKKPWRQKGTGRARHGSIRSPIWVGGGVAHGPTKDANFKKTITKTAARVALASVLSSRVTEGNLIAVDALNIESGKTKDGVKVIAGLSKGFTGYKPSANILVVLPGGKDDALTLRALSNIPHVQAVRAQDLNVLLALAFAYVIATKDALAVIEKTFAVKK